ncbi:MAG: SDR family oxidoreductase [Rhodoblastus sp.]
MRLFIFGVGYCAAAYLAANRGDWDEVVGTMRASDKARRAAANMRSVDIMEFGETFVDPRIEGALARSDALIASIPPGSGDPALRRFGSMIRTAGIRRIVYLSTLGVYGDAGGGWVDETTPPDPAVSRSMAREKAEREWLELATPDRRVFVLRLAGIYGPGRNAIASLRAGAAQRIVKPGQVFNRIHVADIARTIAACLVANHPGGVINVCDDEPAPPQDVTAWAAKLIGVAPPPEIPFAQAALSPMAASFWATNKRVSNRRLREDLGVKLAYPSFREGLAALQNDGLTDGT